jgi:hypothetical protein
LFLVFGLCSVETKEEERSREDAEITKVLEQKVTEGTEGQARFLCYLCSLLFTSSVVP